MGFESFRVELRGGQATRLEAAEVVRTLPHVTLDTKAILTQGSTCYRMDDGQHVIEIELLDAPVRLSCRFTLCHEASVDSAFLSLLGTLMAGLVMEARICDDVRPEHAQSYSFANFTEFSAACTKYIDARRREWIGAFGPAQFAATTSEVHERIILPRCETDVEHPKLTPG